jgi:hypothetical protein
MESLTYGDSSVRELNDFAWFLSTHADPKLRDGRWAVQLASLACNLTTRTDPHSFDTLAAAFAESGDFKAAVETQRKALELLSAGGPNAEAYRARLEGYEAKRPFRATNEKSDEARN